MKHKIGSIERIDGFGFVDNLKTVPEKEFFETLEEKINKWSKSKKVREESLLKAKDYLSKGKSVTIETDYFEITKR